MASRRTLSTRTQVTSRRSRYTAPALEKGLDIIELLTDHAEGLSLAELAKELGRTEAWRDKDLINFYAVAQGYVYEGE